MVARALFGACAVAACLVGAVAVTRDNPLYAYGFVGAVFAALVLTLLVPSRWAVAAAAIPALTALAAGPAHLVPTAVRFSELGGLLGLTALALIRRPSGRPWAVLLLAPYFAILWLSTAQAGVLDAQEQLLMHLIVGVSMAITGTLASDQERVVIARWTIILGVAVGAYAVFEFVAQPLPLYVSPVPPGLPSSNGHMFSEVISGGIRSQATFGHPLLMAMWLLVAFALALRSPTSRRWTQTLILVTLVGGILAAGSRSALAIAVVFVLFTIGARRFSATRATVAAVLAGSFVLLAPSSLLGMAERDSSASHRLELFSAVPRLLTYQDSAAVLWGNGWASRELLYSRGFLQRDGFVAVDNQLVSLLTTAGVVGLALFCLAAIYALVRCPFDTRLALGAGFAMFFVFDVLEYPSTWGLLALLIGLALPGVVRAAPEGGRPAQGRQRALEDARSLP